MNRADLRNELKNSHLGATYWSDAKLNYFIGNAIDSLYPTWYQRKVATTTAGSGPLQTPPAGCKNIYEILIHSTNSPSRPHWLRGWVEGDGAAYIPVTRDREGAITGRQLVWGWTEGWTDPGNDSTDVPFPRECREVVILKAKLQAYESLLTDKITTDKYLASQVRPQVSEEDIFSAIDTIQQDLRSRAERAVPLPEVMR